MTDASLSSSSPLNGQIHENNDQIVVLLALESVDRFLLRAALSSSCPGIVLTCSPPLLGDLSVVLYSALVGPWITTDEFTLDDSRVAVFEVGTVESVFWRCSSEAILAVWPAIKMSWAWSETTSIHLLFVERDSHHSERETWSSSIYLDLTPCQS